jgi:predicted ATPase/class 3 adenylate cyclase
VDFDALFAQVIALLQREQRISYRVLKRRFALSDDDLADLKDELIYAKKLAVDENNRVLVWTGNIEGTIDTPAPPPQSISAPPTQKTPSLQPASSVMTSRTLEAERRQLTVMFCDLVDSTKLSSQLDPEEYRKVVRAYQAICTEVIRRYDGHVAQLLGDGLLVYFGYPQAHEDDAQRAVRAGLGILTAMGALNSRLQQDKGIQLAIRVGIHTGLVVVGEMGGEGRYESLALGEVPNVCSRIQGLAEPDTIIISSDTYRLIQGYFECQDLGAQALRGVTEPIHVYQVLRESGATSRLDVAQPRGLTPLVGRESEVALLVERWEQAKAGHGQVVLLSGEAGIGKSRLVQVLKEHVAQEPHVRWECRSAEYSQNTALFPLTDLFQRLLRFQTENTPDEKLGKLEQALSQFRLPLEESVQLFAPLLLLPIPEDRYPLLNVSPQRQRRKTLETIVAILLELAAQQPVLFIVEDLHWTDPTTLELMSLLLDQTPTASLLVLLTCRPHFQPAWHHRSYITEMTLNHLSHAQVEQLVNRMTDGKTFPQEVLQRILTKTDGVPLFVEELTKAILESGQLKETDGHYALAGSIRTLTIPATLQDSLMARLDRLVTAKGIAQLAAVIGRQFAYPLLQMVSQVDEITLQRELGRLVEAELLYQRGLPPQATYVFKHALIQDTAYESLLRSTRQAYHRRIADVLAERFPETTENQPELLAHHYTEAGLHKQAVDYWSKAGQKATQRSAYVEAVNHMTQGLAMLTTLPDSPERLAQELELQIALGPAVVPIRGIGAPEAEAVYKRAWELCQRVAETPHIYPTFWGLWRLYHARADLQTARDLGEQLLRLAHRAEDPDLLLQAHHAMWTCLYSLGEFASAYHHGEEGMALYAQRQHHAEDALYAGHDTRVCGLAFTTLALWYLGYPEQSLHRLHEALRAARALDHPLSLCLVLRHAPLHQRFYRDLHAVQERTEELRTVATGQGFASEGAFATMLEGWLLAMHGEVEDGIAQLHQGLAAYQETGGAVWRPIYLSLLAEAYSQGGQSAEALRILDEALALVHATGEQVYEAEIHRLRGDLLLQLSSDDAAEAEASFHKALDIARTQQAKSLELRAAMSLSRLWHQQGKRQEAHDLLASVYHWFTEGFDTADLKDAKTLLDALSAS